MILEYFRLALTNLRHRKKRSWLTIIGTLIGIMAVVSLVSIGQGLENSIQSEFEELGGDKIFIQAGSGGLGGRFAGSTVKLTEDDLQVIENTQGVESVSGGVMSSLLVKYKDESRFLTIVGIPTGERGELFREFNQLEIETGRYIRENDRSNVVVGKRTAEDLFEDEIDVRTKVRIQDREFRVVGIAETNTNPNVNTGVIVPIETARELLDKPEEFDMIVAQVRDGAEPTEVEEKIDENLRQARDVDKGDEDFSTQTAEDLISSFQNQLSIVRAVLIGIGSISLLVGGIGIMNTMYTSVTERTREIGVMKAIGATNKQIMTLFLIESGVIGTIGGLMGATLGIGISFIATELITQQLSIAIEPYIGPELILGSLAFAFIVGMISGVLPAIKAARMKPAEALRYK